MSQNNRILEYLKEGKSLTPLEGLRLFGTFRLGARIYDLKREGHKISTTLVQDGEKCYASYRMDFTSQGGIK